MDNNDSDIDRLFDESAAAAVTPGWLTKIAASTNDLLVNSAIGPYYAMASGYLHNSNEEFNTALLDSYMDGASAYSCGLIYGSCAYFELVDVGDRQMVDLKV